MDELRTKYIKIINKRMFISIGISILLLLLSILFFTWKTNIENKNDFSVNVMDVANSKDIEPSNAYLYVNYSNLLFKLDDNGYNNISNDYSIRNNKHYYLYSEVIGEKGFIIYMSDEQYKEIQANPYKSLKGVVKNIDSSLKKEILSIDYKGEKLFNNNDFKESIYPVYLDMTTKIEESIILPSILFFGCLIIGIVGIIINIVLIMINLVKKYQKKKIMKIIFIMSFIPIILLIGLSTIYAVNGFEFFTEYYSGLKAFTTSLLFFGSIFTIYIPILPIMLLYQIIYIVIVKKKRK